MCDSAAKLTTTSAPVEQPLTELEVADVPVDELDPVLHVGEAAAVAGIRQEVEDDDAVVGMAFEPVVDEVRADEAGAAGDDEEHGASLAAE